MRVYFIVLINANYHTYLTKTKQIKKVISNKENNGHFNLKMKHKQIHSFHSIAIHTNNAEKDSVESENS